LPQTLGFGAICPINLLCSGIGPVASRLVVVSGLIVAGEPVVASRLFVVSRLVVASRLALRWAAQQPQSNLLGLPDRSGELVLGLLRSPTQGKPAHHKKPASHNKPAHHTGLLTPTSLLTTKRPLTTKKTHLPQQAGQP
jgi:hypothetical protein